MTLYRGRPDRVAALVQGDRVHRDLYLSEALFAFGPPVPRQAF